MLAGLRGDEELHRAGIEVVGAFGQFDGVAKQPLAQRFVEPGCWCRFDDLLIAQLHGAVAFMQMNHGAIGIRQNLHFDMPGPLHQLFDKQARVAEGGLRLALAAVEGGGHVVGRIDDAHAPPAAARRGLEHDRVANRLGRLNSGLRTR